MPFLNLKHILIATVVAYVLGFASAWPVQGWRMDAMEARYIKDAAEAVGKEYDRANQISNDYAQVVTWLNEQRQQRAKTTLVEVQKPEYRNPDCVRPESGRLLINDAVRQANAARLPDATLSEIVRDAAAGNDGRPASVGVKPAGGVHGLRIQ